MRKLVVLAFATALFGASASSVFAQPYDHLKCYKMRDPHQFVADVDLIPFQDPPFPVDPGCDVRIRGKEFCIPVIKDLNQTSSPSLPIVGQDLTNDFICYKIRCAQPANPIPDVPVVDQFGSRTLRKFKAKKLCVPAFKTLPTTTTTTTTTTLPPCAQTCPDAITFEVKAGAGRTCASNADCTAGFCDQTIGRCHTDTNLDLGFHGGGFDNEVNDDVQVSVDLNCTPGGPPGPCGQCTVAGWNCDHDTCRCEGDNRTICSTPFVTGGPCGADMCIPYLSQPTPVMTIATVLTTPTCVVNALRAQPTGTYNVDNGAANLAVDVASLVHLGLSHTDPCPTCSGDPFPCDGVRGGLCAQGINAGQSCDQCGVSRSFPAPGGDGASLDCFPDPASNISGTGLKISLDPLTTGVVSLPFATTCDPPLGIFDCACAVCSGDNTLACVDDSVCIAASAGVCNSPGLGASRQPNTCSTLTCNPTTEPPHAPDGECDVGPDDTLCDGVLRASGDPFLYCITNLDCAAFGFGNCTLIERRECFADPVLAAGSANSDPLSPTMVSTFCVPPTQNVQVNALTGYAGPGRICLESRTSMICPSNPLVPYVPGVGF